jgi:hypothetical protein
MIDQVFIQTDPFALPEELNVTVFVFRGSNPAGIPASLGFQFQECIDIVHRKAALTCFTIVLSDLVLVNFLDVEYFVAFFYCQSNLVYDQRS